MADGLRVLVVDDCPDTAEVQALFVGSPIRKLASITDPLGRNGHDETLASWLPIEGENGWLSIS